MVWVTFGRLPSSYFQLTYRFGGDPGNRQHQISPRDAILHDQARADRIAAGERGIALVYAAHLVKASHRLHPARVGSSCSANTIDVLLIRNPNQFDPA
ncbi:hypothetical protein [Trinickia mobilis]|uniref:hypothetical protein n=1 Tax=Trinickia mobilis TaxID=2816356 RepID=UPI001A908603|nr:hypothetical protein [Trinickia mobilis]